MMGPGASEGGEPDLGQHRESRPTIERARTAFDHFTPLSFFRRQFPLLASKEVLRRIGVFKAAHMRQPDTSRMDEQDLRELSAIMERMGPPY